MPGIPKWFYGQGNGDLTYVPIGTFPKTAPVSPHPSHIAVRSIPLMTYYSPYHTLFELLRQKNLSTLSVSPKELGLSDAIHPEIADDILRSADRSWAQPDLPVDHAD